MKACLYSNVSDKELFCRVGFYRDDINALQLKFDNVIATNSLAELYKYRPNLVVSYFYSKSLFVAMICRAIGCKVVITGGADQISPLMLKGWRLQIRRASAFACLLFADRVLLSCSEDIANFTKLCFGFHFLLRKLHQVNHVVTPSPMPRSLVGDRSNLFSAFTLCWMGTESNVRRKGVDRSIRLIALLRRIGVDASLDIAGTSGPGRALIENLSADLGVTEYVRFFGPISEDEKNCRFAQGRIYIQLSEYEGFGVAAAEAFFSGMIVVHSNKGGLRDVIGELGVIVNVDMIDDSNLIAVREFYSQFLRYKVDFKFLNKNLDKYSTQIRANAFFEVF